MFTPKRDSGADPSALVMESIVPRTNDAEVPAWIFRG